MARFASIDIGTNSVLLLVAERAHGRFQPVLERAEITRLGRGVDKTRRLSSEAREETLACLARFAEEAKALEVKGIAVSATSAAREAENGKEFFEEVQRRTGLVVEIISGEHEAQLSFSAVQADFADDEADTALVVLDIGGGSTEFIYGGSGATRKEVRFRRSIDVGSVRLTERFVTAHPIPTDQWAAMATHLQTTFATLPEPPPSFRLVGVAGTVTTLYAVRHEIEPYEAARVHGQKLTLEDVRGVGEGLAAMSLPERKRLLGLQPKRADVICAGALILATAMERLKTDECTVSDRGLRWGLLAEKFGAESA